MVGRFYRRGSSDIQISIRRERKKQKMKSKKSLGKKSYLSVLEKEKDPTPSFYLPRPYIVDQNRFVDQPYPPTIFLGGLLENNYYMKSSPGIPRYLFAMH